MSNDVHEIAICYLSESYILQLQDDSLLRKLKQCERDFRARFIPLLSNETDRRRYLRDQFPHSYGETFEKRLAALLEEFELEIYRELPKTEIEKVNEVKPVIGEGLPWKNTQLCPK